MTGLRDEILKHEGLDMRGPEEENLHQGAVDVIKRLCADPRIKTGELKF
jgi:hypothetical protein